MKVRRAMLNDVPGLPPIERSAGEAFLDIPGLEWIADDAVQSEERHRYLIEYGFAWIAEDGDGAAMGFINSETIGADLHIWEVAVRHSRQRQGAGRALVDKAIGFASSASFASVTLTTFRDLEFNARFYRTLGFEVIEDHELTPFLETLLASEADAGLPRERRCAMRKSFTPS